jgi:hypothetical protein
MIAGLAQFREKFVGNRKMRGGNIKCRCRSIEQNLFLIGSAIASSDLLPMMYNFLRPVFVNKPNHRRNIMKVSQAIDFHLQYQRSNSKKKYGQNL